MLKRIAIGLNRLLWTLIVACLLLVASYVSLGRYYIDYVDVYQQEIVAKFIEYTGLAVDVGEMSGRWEKLSFVLSFKNVRLKGEDTHPVLDVPVLAFKVNPLQSLWHQRLHIDNLNVSGLAINLQELAPGKWRLANFVYQPSPAGFDLDLLMDVILAIEQVALSDTKIVLNYQGGGHSELHSGSLSLDHYHSFRRLHFQAKLQDNAEPIVLDLEAFGDPRLLNFSAKGHLRLVQVDLVDQLPIFHSFGLPLTEAKADAELWIDWQPSGFITLQGQLHSPLVDLDALTANSLPSLENFNALFRLEKQPKANWQLWLPDIHAYIGEQLVGVEKIHIDFGDDQWVFSLPELSLGAITQQLLIANILPVKPQAILSDLVPTGVINDVRFELSKPFNQGRYQLYAALNGVALAAWHGAPAVKGVSGLLSASQKGGVLQLNSEGFAMVFPGIYDEGMSFDAAKTQLHWHIEPERVFIESDEIQLKAGESAISSLFNLTIPLAGVGSPEMFLAVALSNMDASDRGTYIPTVLSPELLSWLEKSITEGQVAKANFIYNGSLLKSEADQRTVQLSLDITDASIHYSDDWPAVSKVAAKLLVDDGHVVVDASEGFIQGLALNNTQVTVTPIQEGGSWLSVHSQVAGDAANALAIVNGSVLRESVGSTFERWQLEGGINASLDLLLPLANKTLQPEITFNSQLDNASLKIPEFNVSVSAISGGFNYQSQKGVYSDSLQGELFHKHAKIVVKQQRDKTVQVDIATRLAMADVAQWSKQPGLVFLNGETAVTAQVKVKSGHGVFTVKSALQGVTIDLPAPFGKTAKNKTGLLLTMPIGEPSPVLTIDVDKKMALKLAFEQSLFTRGLLTLQPEGGEALPDSGFVINGHVNTLSSDEAQSLISRYINADKKIASPIDAEKKSAMNLRVEGLKVDHLTALGKSFDDVLINVEAVESGWQLMAGNSRIQGKILFPYELSVPLNVQLDNWYLEQSDDAEKSGSLFDGVDLATINDTDIVIKNLYIGEQRVGDIGFQLRASADDLSVFKIKGELRKIRFDDKTDFTLHMQKTGDGYISSVNGRLRFGDFSKVLDLWGYDQILETKKGLVDINLQWPAALDNWQLPISEGTVAIKIDKGRFLTSSSGALRVVSVVNFANLLRRLRLDFTDIYKSGISFDEITGRFELANGDLSIVDHLNIESPSSRFRVLGHTDLLSQQLDMDLIVTLPVGKNLPWIAALVGGLPTAAIVYGAGKLFQSQVETVSSAVYSLGGTWDDPQLELQEVFSRQGKDRDTKSSSDK